MYKQEINTHVNLLIYEEPGNKIRKHGLYATCKKTKYVQILGYDNICPL